MDNHAVLSDLCSICHVNVPQYRCPRCSCQTCSAHCVKRHKEWHQCSGKRDPTAKVPRSRLFTPAGIDHDYNFITSIERGRAELEAKVPEINRSEGQSLRAGLSAKNKNIQLRLDSTRVHIEWAPVGMSRQRRNRSRWSKKTREIIWTVEWIHQDGDNDFNQIHDSSPIYREYRTIFLKHNNIQGGQKRKLKAGLSRSSLAESDRTGQDRPSLPAPDTVEFDKASPRHVNSSASVDNSIIQPDASTETPQSSDASREPDPAEQVIPQSHKAKTSPTSELLRQPLGSPDDQGNYYYLVKPRTTGKNRVLVVLSPTDSFLDCLKDQTVLEFPSIQVLSSPPHALPEGFILEHDWKETFNNEQDEMRRLLEGAGDLEAEEGHQTVSEETLPPGLKTMSNTDDILAILERDMQERREL